MIIVNIVFSLIICVLVFCMSRCIVSMNLSTKLCKEACTDKEIWTDWYFYYNVISFIFNPLMWHIWTAKRMMKYLKEKEIKNS